MLLGEPPIHRLLAAEPGRELQSLAPVLSQSRLEGGHQEVAVGNGVSNVHRRMPRREHRDVVLIELRDRPGALEIELVVRNLVDPGAHGLSQELPAGLAADRVGDRADRVRGVDEAQGHAAAR